MYNKYKFNELCKWKFMLEEVKDITFLCEDCKEKIKRQIRQIEREINDIISELSGILL